MLLIHSAVSHRIGTAGGKVDARYTENAAAVTDGKMHLAQRRDETTLPQRITFNAPPNVNVETLSRRRS